MTGDINLSNILIGKMPWKTDEIMASWWHLRSTSSPSSSSSRTKTGLKAWWSRGKYSNPKVVPLTGCSCHSHHCHHHHRQQSQNLYYQLSSLETGIRQSHTENDNSQIQWKLWCRWSPYCILKVFQFGTMMIREDLAGPNSFVRTISYLKGL